MELDNRLPADSHSNGFSQYHQMLKPLREALLGARWSHCMQESFCRLCINDRGEIGQTSP